MITVQNDRIRVTVTQDVGKSFATAAERLAHAQVLPSGDVRVHSPEQIQRGLILSEAMSKLGNASELKFLENEEPDSFEVTKLAKLTLMRNYLEQYGRYNADDAMMRYEEGHRMSQGMQRDVMEAEAYAQGQLAPISDEDARTDLINYVLECVASGTEPTQRELHFKKKLMDMKTTGALGDEAASAVAEAADALNFFHEIELRYRKAHANMDGWQIEVIGDMPDQIGLCRYAAEASV